MIPFFGMVAGVYFIWTADIRGALLLAGLALTQSLICLLYVVLNIIAHGHDGILEVEVQLRDALMPAIFLILSSSSFLILTLQIAKDFMI
tara:strand:- start:61 stop:330 length:270 start_codon:yes stop_codon:yes gene_type:complete